MFNKITFENGTSPYINEQNLNLMQDNIETAINENGDNLTALEERLFYSLEEKQYSKWIDGKPIYRKVIPFTVTKIGSPIYLDHNIPNIKFIVNISGIVNFSNDTYFVPLNFYNSDGLRTYAYSTKTSINMQFINDLFLNKQGYIFLEYTKTTD